MEMSLEQQRALARARARMRLQEGATPVAEEPGFLDEAKRVAGRTGRNVAGIAGSLLDAPRAFTDAGAAISGGLSYILPDAIGGGEERRQYLRQQIARPTVADYATELYDRATDREYAPQNDLEADTDTITQIGGSLLAPSAASKIARGVKGALPSLPKRPAIRGADELDEAAEAIKREANAAYAEMRAIGANLTPDGKKKLLTTVTDSLKGEKLNRRLHGDTIGLLNDFKKDLKRPDFGMEDLEQWRRLFGGGATKNVNGLGQMADDGRLSLKAQSALDDAIDAFGAGDYTAGGDDAVAAVQRGREAWKRNRKFERIALLVKNADGDPNVLKRKFSAFVTNPKNLRGFSKEEIALMQRASKLGTMEHIERVLGKFGFTFGTSRTPGNTALPSATLTAGLATGNPAMIAAPIAGTVARSRQATDAQRAAENVLRSIESGGRPAVAPAPYQIPQAGLNAAGMGGAAAQLPPRADVPAPMPEPVEAEAPSYEPPAMPENGADPWGGLLDEEPAGDPWGGLLDADTVEGGTGADMLPDDIRADEGLRHSVYTDTTGNRTVAWGFNMDSGIARNVWKRAGIKTPFKDVYAGEAAITDAEAEALGQASYQIAMDDASSLYGDLDAYAPSRREALLNLSYQLGKPSLMGFRNFNRAVKEGNWTEAARHLLKSDYAKQVPARAREQARKLLREA